jgi:2-aminoadipate transaminase
MAWKLDGGTSMLSQMIAAEYLQDNLWQHIQQAAGAVKEKRNILLDALEAEFGKMQGIHWTHPDGGLFLWIKLPEHVDRGRLLELATARGITYATGQAFHALNQDIPYLRLAFGWIDKQDIAEGVRLLAECVRQTTPAAVPS